MLADAAAIAVSVLQTLPRLLAHGAAIAVVAFRTLPRMLADAAAIAVFANRTMPRMPVSIALWVSSAVPTLPALLRLLTVLLLRPRLSLHTAGTQRHRSEEHCNQAKPCQ